MVLRACRHLRGALGVGTPAFVEAGAPADDELHALRRTVIARLIKLFTRRGMRVQDDGQSYLAETDADGAEARTLRPPQAAASRTASPSAQEPGRGC